MAAVGFGKEGDQTYYILKNSWGEEWGEKGYIRIAATPSGTGICGVQRYGAYPQVIKVNQD